MIKHRQFIDSMCDCLGSHWATLNDETRQRWADRMAEDFASRELSNTLLQALETCGKLVESMAKAMLLQKATAPQPEGRDDDT